MEPLIQRLKDDWDIPDEELGKFMNICRKRIISKGEYFIRAGELPRKMGFAISGLFRYVYINKEGKEFTKSFMPAGRFISAYSSMISVQPAYFFIEALEDAELLEFNYEGWLELRKSHHCWDRVLLKAIEKGFTIKEKRERELLLLDAESRYHIFLEEFPDLEGRVKQSMIASYLGITPERLSRIRKNMGLLT